MPAMTLAEAARAFPFPDYADWWPVGEDFIRLMRHAILETGSRVCGDPGWLARAQQLAEAYIAAVYQRPAAPDLVAAFAADPPQRVFSSGEFDALSYAFYRDAFESILAGRGDPAISSPRAFAVAVGAAFFDGLLTHLRLAVPATVRDADGLERLRVVIDAIGGFLVRQGYLRDHFAFRFDVQTQHSGLAIAQTPQDAARVLRAGGTAYALYEMGYPIILPSAVILFHTMGEAQHHSSRTIEELFARAGCQASETDDFDPSQFPSERVVELWQIRS
jgi:hypothetical protein